MTARLSGALATKLVQRALAGQGVRPRLDRQRQLCGTADEGRAELLGSAAGMPVAVVRRGDSLATVLGAAPVLRSVRG